MTTIRGMDRVCTASFIRTIQTCVTIRADHGFETAWTGILAAVPEDPGRDPETIMAVPADVLPLSRGDLSIISTELASATE